MTFLLGALKFLKAIPWQVWLFAALALFGWRWHVNAVDKAVTKAVAEVRQEWAAENAQEDADAIKAREGWEAMVAARDADIAALKAAQAEADTKYQKSLASARRAADAISRGVAASVRANPQDPAVCSLSDDTLRLLNEQTRQANIATGQIAGAPVSGLPGELQSCPVVDSGTSIEGLRGSGGSLRLASQSLWGTG